MASEAQAKDNTEPNFLWGTATAAYQIEGAIQEDGRGPSIWDTFTHQAGKTERGETGDVACDHYHHWRDDLDLMTRLSLTAYRFSIAWSRILPQGAGTLNQMGLDFYDRLVDGLLARGIMPWATLYHWDLPQALQDKGGWLNRDTASYYADYADRVTSRLGDRVHAWITLNEPYIAAQYGYVEGVHAPGLQDQRHFMPVMHHLLLGHGLALPLIRRNSTDARVGVAYSIAKIEPAGDTDADAEAARRADNYINRSTLDPVLRASYPDDLMPLAPPDLIQTTDMAIIGAPTDFIGINYYTRILVRAPTQTPEPSNFLGFAPSPAILTGRTAMDWEVYPQGLADWLPRMAQDYPDHAIYITESGCAFPDTVTADGTIQDTRRVAYTRDYIRVVLAARSAGVPVHGYFVWSLIDNFEWSFGYRPRFGIVYVDFATQQRTIKESGHWYARFIASGAHNED